MENAPYHADVADGPDGGRAFWLTAADGIRSRAVLWPCDTARATVFLFPGRSEPAEKYGRTAQDLVARGYAVLAIDWRGQGLADRLLEDVNIGHVERFSDYQLDVAAYVDLAEALEMPRPWHMIAHSMGGCIGLRTLIDRRLFSTAAFSAPMWGISITRPLKPLAQVLPALAERTGLGGLYAPTTSSSSYLLTAEFDGNLLTTDQDMWDYMVQQVEAYPAFRLGGPSLTWLAQALAETRALEAAPRPHLPVHTSVGSREKIVDAAAIRRIMDSWPEAGFTVIRGAEHEILMDTPAIRGGFLDTAQALFDGV